MALTRRDLLVASVRALPVLGGGGLVWAGAQELLTTAPRARFWTTASLAGADCLKCHPSPDVLKKPRHAHDAKPVVA